MKITEKDDFENFCAGHYMFCEISLEMNPHDEDEYAETEIQLAWESWQARAKLERTK